MFCFITDFLRNQMKSHPDVKEGVEQFQDRIADADTAEEARKIFNADQYLPHPFLRHEINKQTRLMGKVKQWEGEEIVVLYRVLQKGGSGSESYDRFDRKYQQDENEALNWLARPLDSSKDRLRSEFAQWRDQQKEEQRSLPDRYRSWMRPPQWRIRSSGASKLILETDAWVRTVADSEEWPIYFDVLETLLISVMGDKPTSAHVKSVLDYDHIYICEEEARYVLFSLVEVDYDNEHASRAAILLIEAFQESPSAQEIQRTVEEQGMKRLLHQIEDGNGVVSATELIPNAVRAYPEDVLEDRDTWKKVLQNAEEANLALSPEESQVLERVGDHSADQGLPLFINGRAGSGKSTMLLYLFADYCHRRLRGEEETGDPIFITYSERLLEKAKQTVLSRLNCNAEYIRKRQEKEAPKEVEESDIAPFFSSFQNLLRRQLPGDRQRTFSPSSRVTFAGFKDVYQSECHLPIAKQIAPGLAWHVIRTFIKGYQVDGPLTPAQYRDLPQGDRQWVSGQSYRMVYDKIYAWYEKHLSETGRWDDQDLVKEVLETGGMETRPVVFCDEAQDFTRIELDLLRSLSTFSHYDFDLYETNYLPFAFAGDPLQTLNPTGFRWARLRSRFHDQLVDKLPTDTSGTHVGEKRLEFNYRSRAAIVHVCNLILGWRQHLFGGSLKPQRAWSSIENEDNVPRLYILDMEAEDDSIISHDQTNSMSVSEMGTFLQEGRTVIVPCEEGRETEYLENDDFLREYIQWDETTDSPPQDLMTAIEAKGLDLDQVVVYGFGEFAHRNGFEEGLSASSEEANQESLEKSYFFNRLYVALSRAVNELVIVEPPSGSSFWRKINDTDIITRQDGSDFEERPDLYDLDPVESRKPYISGVPIGDKNDLQALSDPDLERDAENFFTKGLEEKSAQGMARAARKYRAVNEHREAQKAEAFRYKFKAADSTNTEERRATFERAGDEFRKIGQSQNALDSYWKAHTWKACTGLAEMRHMREEYPGRYAVAQFMSDPTAQFLTVLEKIEAELIPEGSEQLDVAAHTLHEVGREKLEEGSLSEEEVRRLSNALFRLSDVVSAEKESELEMAAAKFLYRTGDREAVMETCSDRGLFDSPHYRLARAEDVGYPQGLEQIAKIPGDGFRYLLRTWDNQLDESGAADDLAQRRKFILSLSEPTGWSDHLAEPLNRSQRYTEAFWLHVAAEQTRSALSNLKQILGQSETDYDEVECLKAMVNLLIQDEDWGDLLDLINREFGHISGEACKTLQRHTVRSLADTKPNSEIPDTPQRTFRRWANDWIEEGANPVRAGLALERIGHYRTMVEFYENHVDSGNAPLRRYARKRLIAALDRWADFEMQRGNRKAARQREQRREELIQSWEGEPNRFRSSKRVTLDQDEVSEVLLHLEGDEEELDHADGPSSGEHSDETEMTTAIEDSETREPDATSRTTEEQEVESSKAEPEKDLDEVNVLVEMKRTADSHRLWVKYGDKDDGLVVDLEEAKLASNGFVNLDSSRNGAKTRFCLEADEEPKIEGILIDQDTPVLKVEVEGLEHTIQIEA